MSVRKEATTGAVMNMAEARKALLERIVASRHFSNSELPKRLLNYICEKTTEPGSPPLREQEIATRILGRSPDFDPKADPVVRVNVANIRERLNRYFDNEGRDEAMRLMIPRGQYRAAFMEADAAFRDLSSDARSRSLQRLWQPYLTQRLQTRLLFTDLLCFTNDRGNFIRNVHVNRPETPGALLKKRFPGLDPTGYRPVFPYVSAGEVRCLVRLLSMFWSHGVAAEAAGTRFCSWNMLKDLHLILLGSSRTNPFLESLQGGFPFVIQDDRIENCQRQPGELPSYRSVRDKRGHLDRFTEYALVTRIPGIRQGRVVSIIAANHEKATEGAGDFLTSESDVRQLLEYMRLDRGAELPSFFQVILKIEMVDQTEEVVQTEPVAFRVGEPPEQATA